METQTLVRSFAPLATLALVLAVAPGAPASAGVDGRQHSDTCRLAARYLPRTPDAVEGWLRHCPSR
jgi:hypothetical protein